MVEDNEGDILLTTETLAEANIVTVIKVVNDGQKAIDFLMKKGIYTNEELPGLILLDINLPKKNGHEVLQFIRRTDAFRHIPVFLLTTSSSEKDILQSYKNQTDSYITKPLEVHDLMNAILKIETFRIYITSEPVLPIDYAKR